jgi:hypothetical protein
VAALGAIIAVASGSAFAQVDLTGGWDTLEYQDFAMRGPGPDPVDYTGLPINDAARSVALSFTPEQISLPEEQCLMYAPDYHLFGPFGFRMTADSDPVTGQLTAWNVSGGGDVGGINIWMDGRPPPPAGAGRSLTGFTTGAWEGDVLVSHTTQMRRGYLRRNGVPISDQASMTLRFVLHGNLLTLTGRIEDPAYLTEPLVVSRILIKSSQPPGGFGAGRGRGCNPAVEVADYAQVGTMPHYLPGQNPTQRDMTDRLGIPQIAVLGGADTMYPEFRKRLMNTYKAPAKCDRYCCVWDPAGGAAATLRGCATWMAGDFPPQVYRPPAPITP